MWAKNYQQQQIKNELGLRDNNYHTVVDWCHFIREVCVQDNQQNEEELGSYLQEFLWRNRVRENHFSQLIKTVAAIYAV